jgi:hypothetical protein
MEVLDVPPVMKRPENFGAVSRLHFKAGLQLRTDRTLFQPYGKPRNFAGLGSISQWTTTSTVL